MSPALPPAAVSPALPAAAVAPALPSAAVPSTVPSAAVPPAVPAGAPEPVATTPARRHHRRRLAIHYVQMVVAMAVGMTALHPVWSLLLDAAGWSAFLDVPEAMALVMATNMTIAMTAWMRFRGHGWRPCAEMGAAMFVPFLALFPPMWAGWIDSEGMLLWGHVLMLVTMAGAMALRPHEYAH